MTPEQEQALRTRVSNLDRNSPEFVDFITLLSALDASRLASEKWIDPVKHLPDNSWTNPVLGIRYDGLRVLTRYSGGVWQCKSFDNSPAYLAEILRWQPLPAYPAEWDGPEKNL